ncbi:MAG: ThiF family adenylyltransferase [Armatimonadetes bacterium]|nr:ThiF family adenylyltransferase [Armatimonadota bacterium]
MFSLTPEPISATAREVPSAGGFVSFEGKVRDHAGGRQVLRLEYEAFDELAVSEGELLCQEAMQRFRLLDVRVIHRTGRLEIGETAVLIQVAAAHRKAAFEGCEWLIDELKKRVPIWKKEFYADGDSGWVAVEPVAPIDERFYERQLRLPEVGEAGQQRLREARVLLVGVGGLASGSLPYLAAAGIGTIGLVDDDVVDVSNLHRQILYRAQDEGKIKVERAAEFAKRLNPTINITTIPYKLSKININELVEQFDWVVDGTDSLEVKFLLNAACKRLRKPFTTASVHRFEGQILTVMPDGPCLQCLFPETPPDACVGTCAEEGVLGLTPGLFGILQANEVLKGLLGYGEVLSQELMLFDLRTGESQRLARQKREYCPACQGDYKMPSNDLEVATLEEAQAKLGEFRLVDVRESDELPRLKVKHEVSPLSRFTWEPSETPTVFICAHGVRSYQVASQCRAQGISNAYSLAGGVLNPSFKEPV